jgi:hypothetical protein
MRPVTHGKRHQDKTSRPDETSHPSKTSHQEKRHQERPVTQIRIYQMRRETRYGDQSQVKPAEDSARIGGPKRACAKIVKFVSHFRDASNSPRRLLSPFCRLSAPFPPLTTSLPGQNHQAIETQSLHVIPSPCWDKAICIPGERSLERGRFESTISSRNLFKDRTINSSIPRYYP